MNYRPLTPVTPPTHRRSTLLLILIAALFVLTACGGNTAPGPTAAPIENPETADTETVDAPADTDAETAADTETGAAADTEAEAAATPPTSTESSTETITDTVPVVASPTVLRVGINLGFQPFVYEDENGNLTGFDIDLINTLASTANFEIAYVETPFEGIFERLNAGEYDAVISAITVTEERQQRVDFTSIYFQSGQAIVSYFNAGQGLAVRVDDTVITGTASLTEATRVGVKEATTGDTFATEETPAEVVRYPEAENALNALLAGEVDAVILDVAVLAEATAEEGQIKLAGPPVTQEEYAIAVAEGDTATLDMLNAALEEIRRSGAYDQLIQKWFGSP